MLFSSSLAPAHVYASGAWQWGPFGQHLTLAHKTIQWIMPSRAPGGVYTDAIIKDTGKNHNTNQSR